MIGDILVGTFALGFGTAHVLWSEQMYDYYRRHAVFRFITGSTVGAMKVHGAILAVLGGALILRGVLR